MEKIDAIILAGGLGTRLREAVSDLPKVLAPVNGKPFLDITLSFLDKSGCINRVIIAVGYLAEKIIQRYRDCKVYNFEILFSEETKLLGTGGAIKKALQHSKTDAVLALNGDSYVDVNIKDLYKAHKKNNSAMTIVLVEVEDADRYGTVSLDENSRVISFEEKKHSVTKGYINAGVYLFDKKLFDKVENSRVLSLEKDILPVFVKKPIYGYIASGKFIDIGIPETYRMSHEYLKQMR